MLRVRELTQRQAIHCIACVYSLLTTCQCAFADSPPLIETNPSTDKAAPLLPISPGPLEAERRALYIRILSARERGCGVSGYLAAFTEIDRLAAKGSGETEIRTQIDRISHSLAEQINRAKQLKERPIDPANRAVSGGTTGNSRINTSTKNDTASGSTGKSIGGTGGTAQTQNQGATKVSADKLMEIMRQQHGDQIPADMTSDELMKQIYSDPKLRKLYDQLQGK